MWILKEMFRLLCVIVFCSNESTTCNIHVCFTWKVSKSALTLACKVGELNHQVFIFNQYNTRQGECSPPFPNVSCHSFSDNATISQNPNTNETVFMMRGDIDHRINGNWTCRHGSRLDVATVEVTVLNEKFILNKVDDDIITTNTSKEDQRSTDGFPCIKIGMLCTSVAYVFAMLISLFIMSISNCRIQIVDEFMKKNCKSCVAESERKIAVCKTGTMLLSTAIFLAIMVLFASFDRQNCETVLALGLVFGILAGIFFSVLCLNNNLIPIAEPHENHDEDHQQSAADSLLDRSAEPHENHDEDHEPSAADSFPDPIVHIHVNDSGENETPATD